MVWWILRILAHFFLLILKQSFLWLIFLRLTVKICQFSLLVEIFLLFHILQLSLLRPSYNCRLCLNAGVSFI